LILLKAFVLATFLQFGCPFGTLLLSGFFHHFRGETLPGRGAEVLGVPGRGAEVLGVPGRSGMWITTAKLAQAGDRLASRLAHPGCERPIATTQLGVAFVRKVGTVKYGMPMKQPFQRDGSASSLVKGTKKYKPSSGDLR